MTSKKWHELTAAERLERMMPMILAGTLPYAEVDALYEARNAERREVAA